MVSWTEIELFLWAVFKVLLYPLGGSALMGAIDLFERCRGKKVSPQIYVIAILVTLLFGTFMAWRESYQEMQTLKDTVTNQSASLSSVAGTIRNQKQQLEDLKVTNKNLSQKVVVQDKVCMNPIRFSIGKVTSANEQYPFQKKITIHISKSPIYKVRLWGNGGLSPSTKVLSKQALGLQWGATSQGLYYQDIFSSSPLPLPLELIAGPDTQVKCIDKIF